VIASRRGQRSATTLFSVRDDTVVVPHGTVISEGIWGGMIDSADLEARKVLLLLRKKKQLRVNDSYSVVGVVDTNDVDLPQYSCSMI